VGRIEARFFAATRARKTTSARAAEFFSRKNYGGEKLNNENRPEWPVFEKQK
jgi:hypothetical protein